LLRQDDDAVSALGVRPTRLPLVGTNESRFNDLAIAPAAIAPVKIAIVTRLVGIPFTIATIRAGFSTAVRGGVELRGGINVGVTVAVTVTISSRVGGPVPVAGSGRGTAGYRPR